MKLATLPGGKDGHLVVVSSDHSTCTPATGVAATLLDALADWRRVSPELERLSAALKAGKLQGAAFEPLRAAAPLPRSWQWLDASAYESHGLLMARVFGMDPPPRDQPLMYQGLSHCFLSGAQDASFPSEADGIDFEGEFGVILDDTPMGVSPEQAAQHVKLFVQINDWSLRVTGAAEMKTGFGWVQGKPACSMAPVAVTPDELGPFWRNGRLALRLDIERNGEPFGAANGEPMAFSFPELIAHAARTRDLCAGTIIGSGTVSNPNYREVGSSCIAERRAIEMLDHGVATTPFMRFGDRVRMEARHADGRPLFGPIDQRVVAA